MAVPYNKLWKLLVDKKRSSQTCVKPPDEYYDQATARRADNA
jgi:hypothetical protein